MGTIRKGDLHKREWQDDLAARKWRWHHGDSTTRWHKLSQAKLVHICLSRAAMDSKDGEKSAKGVPPSLSLLPHSELIGKVFFFIIFFGPRAETWTTLLPSLTCDVSTSAVTFKLLITVYKHVEQIGGFFNDRLSKEKPSDPSLKQMACIQKISGVVKWLEPVARVLPHSRRLLLVRHIHL